MMGINMLGKLWMKIREEFLMKLQKKCVLDMKNVQHLDIEGLKILGSEIL